MKTFYFNTGVRPYIHTPHVTVMPGEIVRNGVMLIPFQCEDVPEGAVFLFACDNPELAIISYKWTNLPGNTQQPCHDY